MLFSRFARRLCIGLGVYALLGVPAVIAENAALEPLPYRSTTRLIAEFQAFLEEHMLLNTPGLAVTIVETGQPSYFNTWGLRKLGSPEAVNLHTTFRLASLSKAFAAATTGIVVDQGGLSWDSKLNSYMPQISLKDPHRQEAISVRHILSNSTGLMPHTYTNLIEHNVPYRKILQKLDAVDFVCNPGSCYTYQNVAYSFIGDILQRATGEEYVTLVEERLFAPLQMVDASLTLNDFIDTLNYAAPHQRRRQKLVPTAVKENYYAVAPAAGVNASISDMENWLQALLGNRPEVLPQSVLDELFGPQIAVRMGRSKSAAWRNVEAAYYGLGWRIYNYAGTEVIFHGGWVQGYHAEIVLIPSRGLGMALLMNSDYTNGVAAVPKFLDLSLGLDSPAGPIELTTAAAGH